MKIEAKVKDILNTENLKYINKEKKLNKDFINRIINKYSDLIMPKYKLPVNDTIGRKIYEQLNFNTNKKS
jgi:hypothetical protein